MLEVYKALTLKFPDYRFGYKDNGMWYDLSVSNKSYTKSSFRRMVEVGLSKQEHANVYVEMVKELRAG